MSLGDNFGQAIFCCFILSSMVGPWLQRAATIRTAEKAPFDCEQAPVRPKLGCCDRTRISSTQTRAFRAPASPFGEKNWLAHT